MLKPANRQDRRRVKYDPEHHYWQGRERLDKQDWAGAADAFATAAKLAPQHAPFHRAYGLAIVRLNKFDKAIQAFKRAAALDPTLARAWSDLGVTMLKAGMGAPAIPYLERALAIEPELDQARTTLAVALANEGENDRALAVLDRTVEDVPNADIQYARGSARLRQGRVAEALATFRRALEIDPDHIVAIHNLLFTLQHSAGSTAESLHIEHQRWGEIQRRLYPVTEPGRGGSLDPDRLPVIGLLSGDLRRHAVGVLTIRAIEGLARRGFRIVCFANQSENDDLTERFRRASARFHQVDTMSDVELTALVRKERIDILLDLAGHTGRHRLNVIARRPAPIQGSWAGYVGTTGNAEMDFLIADAIEVPPGEDRYYSESILRLPDCYTTFEPPAVSPPIAPPPCLADGVVTFGCFNRPSKLNEAAFGAWARVLDRVPTSKLLLKYRGIDTGITYEVLSGMATTAGIPPERIRFEGGSTNLDMQEAYQRVDIGLDSFPYSGGITTLEAIWMGVPVVTFSGDTFASRHSASHLNAVGMGELVAPDLDGYIDCAVALAASPQRLAELRAGLRQRLSGSPLCDGDGFAAAMAQSFSGLWRDYCARRRAGRSSGSNRAGSSDETSVS